MGSEETRERTRSGREETSRPSQVVRGNEPSPSSVEMRTEGDELVVTVSCPEIDMAGIRYAVGRRHLLIWSTTAPRTVQRFVLLSKPVKRKDHRALFRNGVFDFRAPLA